jgi:hypothetical protein
VSEKARQPQQVKSVSTISIHAEKPFDKVQNPFIIKVLKKFSIEGMYINIIKAIYYKTIANNVLNG